MANAPADPVVAQLAAYNTRDLEAFLACFAPDCVVEDGRGTVLMRGRDQMRARYGEMFAANPGLHCQLVHRTRVGAWVLDEERVTGRGPGELHVVVVYRVEGEQIVHVRMLR